MPIGAANLIVFFVVGVWHGAAWKYIVYGMYNGIIIAFSGIMADNYRTWKKKLHITGKETWYYVFTVIRTFILVIISNFLIAQQCRTCFSYDETVCNKFCSVSVTSDSGR